MNIALSSIAPNPRHEQQPAPAADFRNVEGGEEIIVQIARSRWQERRAHHEPRRSTGPLPGLHAHVDHIGVSRRIGSAEDRSRLRAS